ncbi:rhamnogalacturonan lyase family protein [Paenibacillus sp. MAH-36]|uniref:Cadherin-like beta sandwich domain-containing protein n=1 Tax=Paenibacillus violae TaxID=3077234 RepID=A0ABU3RI94_9BACL|nr:cadherin-like beta sandwich domain-containing protein [Paenibacillus sp. PFR10]MDU0203975.1 cadherin-like beta sandwich domain-containing protein [Paenibacillus sp. PFR10]
MYFFQKPCYSCVSKLLIALFLFSLLMPLNVAPVLAADTTFVNENFSTYPLGSVKIGSANNWTVEGTAPVVNVVQNTVTGLTYAAISHDLTGSSYFGQRFAPQTGGFIMQFDVNLPTNKGGTFWVMDGKVNATTAAAMRFQMDAGIFKRNNGPTLMNYDPTHWYRFTMIFNIPKKKYTVSILDLNTGSTVSSTDDFYSARDRISSFGFFTNAGGGKFNLANFKVTSLDLALKSVELSSGNFVPPFSFDPTIENYTINVPYSVNDLTIAPVANNASNVNLKVGSSSMASGSSISVPLTGASSSIGITVTSNVYTDVSRTYTINVNKLEKSPAVMDVNAEGRDSKVLVGWKAPMDPAYKEAHIYVVGPDQTQTLVAAVPKGTYVATINGLTNGITYTFKVTGIYQYENEGLSESLAVSLSATPKLLPARQMEDLGRGLVAIQDSGHVFLGWRLLGTEPENIAFNLYRNGVKMNSIPITDSTNYLDPEGRADSSYFVRAVINGIEKNQSETVKPWNANYLTVPLQKPADGVTSTGEAYTYRANDASVGDLDGDGNYEIVLKWDPSNSKDNSQSGITGNTYLDAYKMDGTRLWRLDMGKNIRAGAHYLHPMVYDLDGDGKAEVAARTADGTVDGIGTVIGDATADYRNSSGYVLSGPEYFTIFEGATGKALNTANYDPSRGNVGDWGDTYGNRVDRFGAAIAYLDGQRPSLILQRGYYTRMVLVAYNWRDGQLTKQWEFDSPNPGHGQGNHQLSVADVDADGKDEIITGNTAINNDGTLLWASGLGHGDAMHLGDLNPARLGMELWTVQEETNSPYSATMLDARTGKVLYGQLQVGADTGRGLSADVDPRYVGEESWAIDATKSAATETNSNGFMFNTDGTRISSKIPTSNFAVWWDGDLSRELLDHDWDGTNGVPKIDKWDYENNKLSRIATLNGTFSNNGTKGNPSLQADILGDWREEVMVRTEDSSALRIYSTTAVTDQRIYTLMHDPVYRLGVAWQNTGYNQPPHTSFYLGNGMEKPPIPNIYLVDITAPTTSDNAPVGWVNNDVSVTFTSSDIGSGVAATYYTLDGGVQQTGTTVNIKEEGIHSLVYWSTDNAGNVEKTHTVSIQIDKTAPNLNVSLDNTQLWPANHKLVSVTAQVDGSDDISGIDSIVLTSITSNEPDQGTGADDQPNDIQNAEYGTLDPSFSLRAERSGQGIGRMYTIMYTATDKAGNQTIKSVNVSVPHDQSHKK